MGYLQNQMSTMGEHLQHELHVDDLFTLPIKSPIPSVELDGGGIKSGINIGFAESTVVSWIVMGVLVVLAIIITSGFRVRKLSGRQVVAEGWFDMFYGMVKNMLGHEAAGYAPYMCTILFFVGISNIFGIFGFKPPTKDLSVTAALAIMSIVVVQIAAIRAKGVGGWAKTYKNPMNLLELFTRPLSLCMRLFGNVLGAFVIMSIVVVQIAAIRAKGVGGWAKTYKNPMNLLELFTRPLSLCMRLFGNVLGAFVIMKLIEHIIPVVLPGFVSLYFDIFDGLLQAYVFTFLTSLFISEAVE